MLRRSLDSRALFCSQKIARYANVERSAKFSAPFRAGRCFVDSFSPSSAQTITQSEIAAQLNWNIKKNSGLPRHFRRGGGRKGNKLMSIAGLCKGQVKCSPSNLASGYRRSLWSKKKTKFAAFVPIDTMFGFQKSAELLRTARARQKLLSEHQSKLQQSRENSTRLRIPNSAARSRWLDNKSRGSRWRHCL